MKPKLTLAISILALGCILVNTMGCQQETVTITASTTTTVTETSATNTTTCTTTNATRTITDMYGRQVTVPTIINRVLATGPVEMEMVYMLAPEKLAGLAFTFNGDPPLVPSEYAQLPVVEGGLVHKLATMKLLYLLIRMSY